MRTRAVALLCSLVLLAAAPDLASSGSSEVTTRENGQLVLEDIPPIPGELAERLQRYQNTRSASFQGWLPGGGMLISTRFGETSQLHVVERPGGARRQITFYDEPVGGARVSPDPEHPHVIFSKDVGGSESYQLFGFDPRGGQPTLLTDGESRNGGARWSHRGDRFAFHSTRRNGRDWDLYVQDIAGGAARPVLEREGAWSVVDWSPDDARLLVRRSISANESRFAVLDTSSGDLTPVNPGKGPISYGFDAAWSPDGRGIYLTSDENTEFRQLRFHDLETGTMASLSREIPWDIENLDLSPDGRTLAFTANEGGVGRLYLMKTADRRARPVAGLPAGRVSGLSFDPAGARLGLVLSAPRTPGDVFALDLETETLTRWTHSEVGGLDVDAFVEPEVVAFDTFDQVDGRPRRIPALYYRPPGAGPFPVLIDIHGGPEGQSRVRFSSTIPYHVRELGLAVLVPNVRGSSGYGKSYLQLDNGVRREDSVRDIGALLDWVRTQPELDADRVGVIGGSYGGYMVLAAMTHFNDRLRCGVDVVGISNFVTFLENTKDYRRDLRRVEYGDERDEKMRAHLMSISPTTSAHKITRPMLIVQGLNDPRVPAGEAEQIVEAIRKNGGDVWYLLARDEGHGFRKKRNRDVYSRVVSLFLERHLLAAGTDAETPADGN